MEEYLLRLKANMYEGIYLSLTLRGYFAHLLYVTIFRLQYVNYRGNFEFILQVRISNCVWWLLLWR